MGEWRDLESTNVEAAALLAGEAPAEFDVEPDDGRVEERRGPLRSTYVRHCGVRFDHPACPVCRRRLREPRSPGEVRWLANNGLIT